ncbi:hypothetical protein FA15DRAFT_710465 [Coprinopsis marcescibilis]|uniref:Uncharacterized protein n=1 Tax=Coprinopsis marcescibilis TaxID=230819 RepID=A0A5C3KDQ6_COPMA|nr:hypothetical protein FA15DRAFT_710465 [Coprinopsis marcescibilis]
MAMTISESSSNFSGFSPDFIAATQKPNPDNVIAGGNKQPNLKNIRADAEAKLDYVRRPLSSRPSNIGNIITVVDDPANSQEVALHCQPSPPSSRTSPP